MKCGLCEYQCKHRSSLNQHINEKHVEKQKPMQKFQSDICGSSTTEKQSLKADLKTLKIKCSHCGKTFKSAQGFKLHMMSHEARLKSLNDGQSPLVPKEEKKTLRKNKKDLKKIFECDLCPSKFHQRINIYYHVTQVHTRPQNLKCQHCPSSAKAYRNKTSLQRHFRRTHVKLPKEK